MRPVVVVAFALLLPALAGCFTDDPAPAPAATQAAGSAEEAGARSGPAPAAPHEAFQVAGADGDEAGETVTAYPLPFRTNAAKPPVTRELTGEFQPQQCAPMGELPLGGLGLAEAEQAFDLTEDVAVGDAFSYDVVLAFENSDDSWGEVHAWYALGAANDMWEEPTGDLRGEVLINFTGQSFRASEEQPATVGAMCWYGGTTRAIPFTLTVTLTFVEGAVPAQTPVLVEAPRGATRLFATGVAVDPSRGVLSHYRVFAPDDSLVCECVLSSNEDTSVLDLPGPGAYVVLVDHTDNGFVSFALDAPSPQPLRALDFEWVEYPVAQSDGGPLSASLTVEMPSTPLNLWAWVFATTEDTSAAGLGREFRMGVVNERGEVLRQAMGGWVTYRLVVPGVVWTNDWFPASVSDEGWEFFNDHHAYASGPHDVTVEAADFRGEAVLFAMHYVR